MVIVVTMVTFNSGNPLREYLTVPDDNSVINTGGGEVFVVTRPRYVQYIALVSQ